MNTARDPYNRPGKRWAEQSQELSRILLDGEISLSKLQPPDLERLKLLKTIVAGRADGTFGIRNGKESIVLTENIGEKLGAAKGEFSFSLIWEAFPGAVPARVLFDTEGRAIEIGPELPAPLETILDLLLKAQP
jgi:hypothetical protein